MTLSLNVINIKKVSSVKQKLERQFIKYLSSLLKNHFQFNFALCSGGSNTHNLTAANYLFYFILFISRFSFNGAKHVTMFQWKSSFSTH